jgi:hypothetical protein
MGITKGTTFSFVFMVFIGCFLTLVLASDIHAFNSISNDWEAFYAPDGARVIASLEDAGGSNCQVCHVNTNGGQPWNAYGFTLFLNGADFAAADGIDSDGSGSTNGEEIGFDPAGMYGAQPGWALEPVPFPPGNVACFEDETCNAIDPPITAGPLDPIVSECGNGIIEPGEDCDDSNTNNGDCCDFNCQFEPAESPCPDGDLCNGDETCDGEGSCQAGTPIVCDDDLACTGIETCDPIDGCQLGTPVECLPGEVCEEPDGICVTPPECTTDADCEDGLFCTVNTCDTETGTCGAVTACPPAVEGCVIINDSCDEENDTCVDFADDTLCIDDSLCTVDTCNITTGLCDNTPVDCSDGVDCTDDTCDEGTGECMRIPNNDNCPDDGFFCTGQEICDPGTGCVSEGDPCPEGTVCNDNSETCDVETDCGNETVEPGEECDDGNTLDGDCCSANCTFEPEGNSCADELFCNGEETCDGAGECLAGTEVDCSDDVNCTIDSCDEINDECVNTPNDNNCPDDGLFCNGQEICDPVDGCVSSGDPCFGEFCNEDEDICEPVECTTDSDCEDGLFCTVNTCDTETGTCGAVTACPPAVEGCVIINDSCDEENDTCVDFADDSLCDDGSLCTVDTCNITTGLCDNTPVECSDGVDCTDDLCDEGTGGCISTPNDNNCPDDGLFCTGEEICHPVNDCVSTGDPCEGQSCNEENDICEPVTGKVTICHIPPGNPANAKTKTIGADAVPDHLAHGDFIGECN